MTGVELEQLPGSTPGRGISIADKTEHSAEWQTAVRERICERELFYHAVPIAPLTGLCRTGPLSLSVGLSRGKVEVFLSGSVPTEKCMGNCRRAIRVPCTSSGFRQLPRNRRENTLGLHMIALFRPAGSAPSICQSHGSRVYNMFMGVYIRV